jgi:hypothetical protein
MWKPEHRFAADRRGLRYPSDLTDAEWGIAAPMDLTTWSTHSRRIVPINLSAKQFCHGEAGAMGLSRIPMARNRRVTAAP